MVFTQITFKCSGCGKTAESFFGTDKFKLKVIDYSDQRMPSTTFYCNANCLLRKLTGHAKP